MKCEEFLRLLDNGGPGKEGEAGEHMKGCPSCRAAFEKWEAAAAGLGALKDEEAPPFLHARIMAHVREEADAEPRRSALSLWVHSRWAAPVGLMIAAAAIGGIALVTSFNRTVDRQPPLPAPQAQAPSMASEGRLAAKSSPPRGGTAADRTKADEGGLTPPPLDRLSGGARPPEPDSAAPKKEEETQPQTAPLFGGSDQALPEKPSAQPVQRPSRSEPSLAEHNAASATLSMVPSPVKTKAPEPSAPSMVLCLLSTLDHARFASLQIPSDSVPPPGEKWYVSILDDGGMTLTDGRGRPLDRRVSEAVAGYVSTLRLPSGRYRLTQVGP